MEPPRVIYESSALSASAMFGSLLLVCAGGVWLSAYGGSRALLGGLLVPVVLLVIGCHYLHGRMFGIDPARETITVSNVWLYWVRSSSTTRRFSELRDIRIENGYSDWYVLEFTDGTTYHLHADAGQRRRSILARLRRGIDGTDRSAEPQAADSPGNGDEALP